MPALIPMPPVHVIPVAQFASVPPKSDMVLQQAADQVRLGLRELHRASRPLGQTRNGAGALPVWIRQNKIVAAFGFLALGGLFVGSFALLLLAASSSDPAAKGSATVAQDTGTKRLRDYGVSGVRERPHMEANRLEALRAIDKKRPKGEAGFSSGYLIAFDMVPPPVARRIERGEETWLLSGSKDGLGVIAESELLLQKDESRSITVEAGAKVLEKDELLYVVVRGSRVELMVQVDHRANGWGFIGQGEESTPVNSWSSSPLGRTWGTDGDKFLQKGEKRSDGSIILTEHFESVGLTSSTTTIIADGRWTSTAESKTQGTGQNFTRKLQRKGDAFLLSP